MKMTDKINMFMKYNGIKNYFELSEKSGIPYSTIQGFYKKGYFDTKLSTLHKLKSFMKITLDELADDNIEIDFKNYYFNKLKNSDLEEDEKIIISNYRNLNNYAKQKINEYVDDIFSTGKYLKVYECEKNHG